MGMSDDALSHAAHDAGTGRNGAVGIRMLIYVNTNVFLNDKFLLAFCVLWVFSCFKCGIQDLNIVQGFYGMFTVHFHKI